MKNPETPGQKAKKARARKPSTIEGKAKDVTPKPAAVSAAAPSPAGPGAETPSAAPDSAVGKKDSPAAGGAGSSKGAGAVPETGTAKGDPASPAVEHGQASSAAPAGKRAPGKPTSDKPAAANRAAAPNLLLPLLASGLVGGIAAVLILWGADRLQMTQEAAPAALGEVEDRLSALENRPAGQSGVSQQAYDEAVSRLEGEMEELRQAIASQETGQGADTRALEALESRLVSLEQGTESAENSRQQLSRGMTEVEDRIGSLAHTLSSLQAEVAQLAEVQEARETSAQLRAAAALPVLGSLAEAVAAGRPTASYRDTLDALGVAGARSGDVPSDQDIQGLLEAARAEAPETGTTAEPSTTEQGGVLSQLQSSLSGLVTVRRTGSGEGPSPLDPVAEAITAGNFAEARERLDAINAEGEATSALASALEARAAFEAAIAGETARLADLLSGGN